MYIHFYWIRCCVSPQKNMCTGQQATLILVVITLNIILQNIIKLFDHFICTSQIISHQSGETCPLVCEDVIIRTKAQ